MEAELSSYLVEIQEQEIHTLYLGMNTANLLKAQRHLSSKLVNTQRGKEKLLYRLWWLSVSLLLKNSREFNEKHETIRGKNYFFIKINDVSYYLTPSWFEKIISVRAKASFSNFKFLQMKQYFELLHDTAKVTRKFKIALYVLIGWTIILGVLSGLDEKFQVFNTKGEMADMGGIVTAIFMCFDLAFYQCAYKPYHALYNKNNIEFSTALETIKNTLQSEDNVEANRSPSTPPNEINFLNNRSLAPLYTIREDFALPDNVTLDIPLSASKDEKKMSMK